MTSAERIDLAHEPDFRLGRVAISPVRRQLERDDGQREVIEHKVMQVLVALARADGGVVTRDELTRSCWEGRVVGEDAINRVISRLRKAADGIGEGAFRIETVTKIGYRLVAGEGQETVTPPAVSPAPNGQHFSRRTLIAGAAATGAAALGLGGALLYRARSAPPVSREVASLIEQGKLAMAQGTREGQSQAIGLYRRATELAPGHAEGWGQLALAYAHASRYRADPDSRVMRERAEAAARRALEIDPENAHATLIPTLTTPLRGNWIAAERTLRRALDARPQDDAILATLAGCLCEVGRFREAAALLARIGTRPLTPSQYYQRIHTLWGAGRIEERDLVIAEGSKLYPTQFSLWFVRFYVALFDGRPGVAIAQGEDVENRPSGIPAEEFDDILAVARAALSREPAAIEAVVTAQMRNARRAAGKAENALQFLCLFGRLDEAFAIADAYYFGRGFEVPAVRFSVAQGTYSSRGHRSTRFLLAQSTRALRGDSRFPRLAEELGLERYWREAGVQPDYRSA